jgi:hypothetical protein
MRRVNPERTGILVDRFEGDAPPGSDLRSGASLGHFASPTHT